MSSRIFVFVCALLAGIFLVFATAASGVIRMVDPKHGVLYVWTEDEMDKLESALQELIAERDALKRRVAEYRQSCT